MKKFVARDFRVLRYEFLSSPHGGKIMMTDGFESEEATWGPGMVVQVGAAHSFLLHIIRTWYDADNTRVIGDIDALKNATGELDEHQMDELNRKRNVVSIAKRRKRQLEYLLRREKRLQELAQKNYGADATR